MRATDYGRASTSLLCARRINETNKARTGERARVRPDPPARRQGRRVGGFPSTCARNDFSARTCDRGADNAEQDKRSSEVRGGEAASDGEVWEGRGEARLVPLLTRPRDTECSAAHPPLRWRLSTVDGDRRAVHERALVAREEKHDLCDLLRRRCPSKRNTRCAQDRELAETRRLEEWHADSPVTADCRSCGNCANMSVAVAPGWMQFERMPATSADQVKGLVAGGRQES